MSYSGLMFHVSHKEQVGIPPSSYPAIQELLGKLWKATRDIAIYDSATEDEHGRHPFLVVVVKKYSMEDDERRTLECLFGTIIGSDFHFTVNQQALCWRDGCFAETAASGVTVDGCGLLFDKYGEQLHPMESTCLNHLPLNTRQIIKTLESKNLTPDRSRFRDWALTWKVNGRWYAQCLSEYQDGDHETGYYDCMEASPYLGPFPDRATALQAAQDNKAFWDATF